MWDERGKGLCWFNSSISSCFYMCWGYLGIFNKQIVNIRSNIISVIFVGFEKII